MAKSDEMRSRTKRFAASVTRLYVSLDKGREKLRVLGWQVLRAGTSVGANYREASRARSGREFIAKIELCVQEADETQYWIGLLREDCDLQDSALEVAWNESDELIRIFVTMARNTKSRQQV